MKFIDNLKARLIPTWQHAHKYVTVQLAGLLILVSTAYDYLPAIHQYLPEGYSKYIGIAIIVARIVSQPKVVPTPPKEGE